MKTEAPSNPIMAIKPGTAWEFINFRKLKADTVPRGLARAHAVTRRISGKCMP